MAALAAPPARERELMGECYCGGVRFAVRVPAEREEDMQSAFCFCQSCKRAHAAPLYQVVYLRKSRVRLERGAELVEDYAKTPGEFPVRAFCRRCGSRVFNKCPDDDVDEIGFFPALLDHQDQLELPQVFVPTMVCRMSEQTLDVELLRKTIKQQHEELAVEATANRAGEAPLSLPRA
jgi:hypothetical protein